MAVEWYNKSERDTYSFFSFSFHGAMFFPEKVFIAPKNLLKKV